MEGNKAMAITPNSEFVIFITHVEEESVFLKIWGQIDKTAATYVEQLILPYIEHFMRDTNNFGLEIKNFLPNTLCCAKFQNEGYYRAKIINVLPDGLVLLQFIDYGNIEKLHPRDVHLLNGLPGTELLQTIPPVAFEFVLANVLPINKLWDSKILLTIKQILMYNEYKALLYSTANSYNFIKLYINGEEFNDVLIKQNMAAPASLNEMLRIKGSMHQMRKPYLSSKAILANNPLYTEQAPVYQKINTPSSWHNQNIAIQQQTTPPVHSIPQEALVFKSRVLEIGSTHEVYISFVEDGPLKFSIQLQSNKEALSHLMKEINKHPTEPLKEPPLPGSVCLGRYTGDKVLCRAVVMAVTESKCKVYYVDFGHTEVLPYTDIFQLPPQYISPRVLSIRFTLSNLDKINKTEEMKDYFKEIVSGKLLILHVRPPQGPPLIQYGDLYDNSKSIREMLESAYPDTIHFEKPLQLQKGNQEIVCISYIETCVNFFVQLTSQIKALEDIMSKLAKFCEAAPALNKSQASVGLPCAALYESQWYRVKIISITGDNATIVYVDYGNKNTVKISSLRLIRDDLVIGLREQAIKCCWNDHDQKCCDAQHKVLLEKLILNKYFHLKVAKIISNNVYVDISDPETMEDVKTILMRSSNKGKGPSLSNQNGNTDTSPKSYNQKQFSTEKPSWRKPQSDNWSPGRSNTNYSDTPKYGKDNYDKEINTSTRYDKSENSFSNENRFKGNKFAKDNSFNHDDTNAAYKGRNKYEDNPYPKSDGNKRESRKYNSGFSNKEEYNRNDQNDFNSTRGQRFNQTGSKRYNDTRSNRNGLDKSFNDRDSDSSSKSNKSFGRSPGNYRDNRPKQDNARNAYPKFNKKNEDFGNNKFRDRKETTNNWDSNKPAKSNYNVSIKIPELEISMKSVKNCELVFTKSPSEFYIQLYPEYLELEQIMENINTNNSEEKTLQDSECVAGAFCISQYSEDLRWYRAKIINVSGDNATVFFVDYGNTEEISFDKIKALQPEFANLPMQAVRCQLLGQLNDTWNLEEIKNFVEMTEGKCLEAEFVKKKNNAYEVLLREIVDGVSSVNYINQTFCSDADLTVMKESTLSESQSLSCTPSTNQITEPEYVSPSTRWTTAVYDLETKFNVIITWFTNPKNFYCHITNKLDRFTKMMNEIQDVYVNRSPINSLLEVGSPVIAVYAEDGALYRGEIVENNKGHGHVVRYVDFGNCAIVEKNKIYPVEKRFTELPKQAVHCGLKDIQPVNSHGWAKPSTRAYDAYFKNNKFDCILHKMKDDKYEVTLFDDGQDIAKKLIEANLALSTEVPVIEKKAGITEKPAATAASNLTEISPLPVSSSEQMIISYADNYQSIWLQRSIDYDKDVALTQELQNYYNSSGGTQIQPEVNLLCAAKSSDNNWYRGKIISYTSSGAYVNFIDYGHSEEINLDNLKLLEQQFYTSHLLSVNVCLNVPIPGTNEEQTAILHSHLFGKELTVNFLTKDDKWVVEIIDNNEKFSDKLKSLNLTDTQVEKSDKPEEMTTNRQYDVLVSHVDSPSQFWLQRLDELHILDRVQENLQVDVSNCLPIDGILEEGSLCCAVYSIDKLWYRAEVIDADADITTVRFIDYGNTDVINNHENNIKQITEDYKNIGRLAVKCKLDVAPVNGDDWDENTCERFKSIVQSVDQLQATVIVDGTPKRVELSVEGKRVSEILVEEQLAVTVHTEEEVIDEIVDTELDPRSAFISHIQSINEFWVHEEKCIADLEMMSDRFLVADMFPKLDSITEGKLCVAKFPEDNLWYRAKIISCIDETISVLYIDYGNSAISTDIREIPEDLTNIPPLSRKCCLQMPEGIKEWSDEAYKKFSDISANGATTFLLNVIEEGETSVVNLIYENESVSDLIATLCNREVLNAEERLPPIGEETSLVKDKETTESSKLSSEIMHEDNLRSTENSEIQTTTDSENIMPVEEIEVKNKPVDNTSNEFKSSENVVQEKETSEKIQEKIEHLLNDVKKVVEGNDLQMEEPCAISNFQNLPKIIVHELSIEDIVERMVKNAANDVDQQMESHKSSREDVSVKSLGLEEKMTENSNNFANDKSNNDFQNTVQASTPKKPDDLPIERITEEQENNKTSKNVALLSNNELEEEKV